MRKRRLCLALDFRNDALGQDLAEFDSPLIERVDMPDCSLCKNGVFIQSNKLPECRRRELFGEDRIRWAVALEDAMRHEPIRSSLGLHLLPCFAERQCLRLCTDIREKHVMVPAK